MKTEIASAGGTERLLRQVAQQQHGGDGRDGEVRVRLHIIRNEIMENVGKSQSCMVSKLRIIWKQTVEDLAR